MFEGQKNVFRLTRCQKTLHGVIDNETEVAFREFFCVTLNDLDPVTLRPFFVDLG